MTTVFPCSIMQRHNLEHIIGAGAILNLAHVKFNLTCVACAKTVFRVVAMHYIQGLENGAALFNTILKTLDIVHRHNPKYGFGTCNTS
ncbi:hypothetical protein BpHYR1_011473 [Brachionus plicatilis]|uniref:Uncharacterized protein n=1 Tax=Brachionus plicatilis TaxID=10195 RepID=A0A3M7QES6_BRAPC|nr:hypothetical protein BpHYR1_011473 [Brachionus plicatilis]